MIKKQITINPIGVVKRWQRLNKNSKIFEFKKKQKNRNIATLSLQL